MRRRTKFRAGVAVGAYLVLLIVARVLEFDPDPLLLALVVGLTMVGAWLAVDTGRDETAAWRVEPVTASAQQGHDTKYASYVRIIEGHLHAREPDANLRDRLAGLAERTLEIRYGLTLDDPRAIDVLGPRTYAVVRGPVRALDLPEIEACLTRIEEL